MGKTYRRDQQYRPKKHGKVFSKDQKPWKKNKINEDDIRDRIKPNVDDYEMGQE